MNIVAISDSCQCHLRHIPNALQLAYDKRMRHLFALIMMGMLGLGCDASVNVEANGTLSVNNPSISPIPIPSPSCAPLLISYVNGTPNGPSTVWYSNDTCISFSYNYISLNVSEPTPTHPKGLANMMTGSYSNGVLSSEHEMVIGDEGANSLDNTDSLLGAVFLLECNQFTWNGCTFFYQQDDK